MEKFGAINETFFKGGQEQFLFQRFYSFFTRSNCSNQLKFWMVCEAFFKLMDADERNLDVAHFTKIYEDFLRNSAPLKVRTSEVTIHMMKMCIEFATVDNLSPALTLLKTAQMEVYPLLLKVLPGDLGFICDLFTYQFTQMQSEFTTCKCCAKSDKLKAATCDKNYVNNGNRDQQSEVFFQQVCDWLKKVQKERDRWLQNVRKEACEQGKSEDFIQSLQWYDFSGCKKYT